MDAAEIKIPSKEEIYIRKFLYETGLGTDNDEIDYKELVKELNIKKEYMHNLEGAEIILKVLGSELGPIKITKTDFLRKFEDEKLNVQYKRLMNKARIFFTENGDIRLATKFYYDRDSINRMDEVLGCISDDWDLQKTFGLSQSEQNSKIAKIVAEEIKNNLEWLLQNILNQAKWQIIDPLNDENNNK